MNGDPIEITLTKDKLREIIHAYKFLGDFLEYVLPKEEIYKANFLHGLENALKDVKAGQTKEIASFDEFVE
ncbi:MAG: hypothetical protein ACE5IR_26200 [bacterium]